MRYTLELLCVVTLASASAFAATPSLDDPAATKQMIDLARGWAEQACGGKWVISDLLADDFQGTSPKGKRYRKPTGAPTFGPETKWSKDCRLDEADVHYFTPDLAVMYGAESSVVMLDDSKEERRCLAWTDTWARRNGRWQIIAVQDNRIDCPNAAPAPVASSPLEAPVPSPTNDSARFIAVHGVVRAEHVNGRTNRRPWELLDEAREAKAAARRGEQYIVISNACGFGDFTYHISHPDAKQVVTNEQWRGRALLGEWCGLTEYTFDFNTLVQYRPWRGLNYILDHAPIRRADGGGAFVDDRDFIERTGLSKLMTKIRASDVETDGVYLRDLPK